MAKKKKAPNKALRRGAKPARAGTSVSVLLKDSFSFEIDFTDPIAADVLIGAFQKFLSSGEPTWASARSSSRELVEQDFVVNLANVAAMIKSVR